MEQAITTSIKRNTRYIFLDAISLTFIYFIPALSHLLSFPVYLFDPMRIVLFLTFAFSSRNNSYIIALTLPIFSYLFSAHPFLPKAILIAAELGLNVFLFYRLAEKFPNKFVSAFFSILLSKIVYYLLKFAFLSFVLLEGDLISTPLYIQLIVAVVLSSCIYFLSLQKQAKF